MLELLGNPRETGKRPWKMFFIGLIYASLSLILVRMLFLKDIVLYKFAGILVVTFCVMFSIPYMYFVIKQEEKEDEEIEGLFRVWRVHKDALYAFMWLFLGFIVAFSFWFIALGDANLFNAQIETYCSINSPGDLSGCVERAGFYSDDISKTTGSVTKSSRLFSILENNVYVMIFTLIFSIIFGAGAIFVLAWNASVIAGAVSIFTKNSLPAIPLGIARYMIHGLPEIAAYFITALAGGIFGVGILKHKLKTKKLIHVMENAIILLFIALIVLVIAGLIEVYITPVFF